MFSKYFESELNALRKQAQQFSEENPSLSSMLSAHSTDPDVERLLEGVAFLTADIKRKIDDEFPEILQTLAQMVCPQHLRPIPASTIIQFKPKENLFEALEIPEGTFIDSKPVDGKVCRFRTSRSIRVSPLQLTSAEMIAHAREGLTIGQHEIKLRFELNGMPLTSWDEETLRIYLAGPFAEAANLYKLLSQHLKEIRLSAGSGRGYINLPVDALRPSAFEEDARLLPYPSNVFPSLQLLQEYFLFPENFLFLDVDLRCWKERGAGQAFEISFVCSMPDFDIAAIDKSRFALFAVPAVNLFRHHAEPVIQDHSQQEMLVQPARKDSGNYRVFTVDKVTGSVRGGNQARTYSPFTGFYKDSEGKPRYQASYRPSVRDREWDLYLSCAYPQNTALYEKEVISVELTCSNDTAADKIAAGNICVPTSNSPELVSFQNICPSTVGHVPQLEGRILWNLVSHLSTNYQSINGADALKTLLTQYYPADDRDKRAEIANSKKVSSILSFKLTPGERIVRNAILRGQTIQIDTNSSLFASPGDLFIFGSVLDYFFGSYSSINTYSELIMEDQLTMESIRWPTRLGTRPLI